MQVSAFVHSKAVQDMVRPPATTSSLALMSGGACGHASANPYMLGLTFGRNAQINWLVVRGRGQISGSTASMLASVSTPLAGHNLSHEFGAMHPFRHFVTSFSLSFQ